MTAPNTPLWQRPLLPGRGRVWRISPGTWGADYRSPDGMFYGVWDGTLSEAHDWIRSKAKEATK